MLAILILIFIIFFIMNTISEKNISIVSIEGESKNKVERNSLIKLLNDISSADKVTLQNITEKWSLNKDTIDEKLKNEVNGLITKILNSISGMSNYKFYINTIENLYVMKDIDGNYRCILNCFIYEVRKYYTIKLVMDFVYYEGETYLNFIDIDESSINNILDKYDVRWQGSGILSNYDMFDENTIHMLDNYYNSKYDIVFIDNKDKTFDKTSLFTMSMLTNNMLPSNAPKDELSPYFCKKDSEEWNNKGIKNKGNMNCIMNDNTKEGILNLPREGPSVITHNPDNNSLKWLFLTNMGPLMSSAQY